MSFLRFFTSLRFRSPLAVISLLVLSTSGASASSPWWETAHVFGQVPLPGTLSDAESVHAWGGTAETPSEVEAMERALEVIHGEGHRYVGTISAFNPGHEALELHPELNAARVIDVDGALSVIPWKSNSEVTMWFFNTNEPIYQDYLKDQVERLIDIGVDAILIDEVEGTAGTINRGGSFGDRDMALFNDYLLTLYTAEQLDQYWGIDIENFNYGDYIRNRGSAEAYRETPFQVPLFQHYRDFQRIAVRAFMQDLIAHGKNYAAQTYGKEIAFTANIYGWASHQILFGDLLDYFTVEYGYREDGYAPKNHALPYMLYGNSRNKRSVMLPGTFTGNEIHTWDTTDIGALWMMESYVTGNTFLHSHTWFGGTSPVDGSFVEFSLDYPNNTRLLEFVRNHPFVFNGESTARVGLLYSYASDYVNYIRNSWGGVAFALLDSHIQFDVLSLGDDIFMEDTFPAEDLSGYDVLVLPWSRNMSQAQLDKLLSFASNGGKLVIVDEDSGTRNLRNDLISRPAWTSVTSEGSRSYGAGEIHVLSAGWDLEYFETRAPAMRSALTNPISGLSPRGTESTAPSTVHMLVREVPGEPILAVHALNYDFDTTTQQITESPSFDLQLRLPGSLINHPSLAVYQIHANGETSRLNPNLTDGGQQLGVTVEPIDVYAAIVVTTDATAQSLTEPVLDDLETFFTASGAAASNSADAIATVDRINNAYEADDFLVARSEALELMRRLQLASRKRVLFADTNGAASFMDYDRAEMRTPENPSESYLGKIAAILKDEFVLESSDAPLTDALLSECDIVVLNSPWFWFDDGELQSLHDFVDDGGGLLVLGNPNLNSALTPVTGPYGIFVHGEVLSQDGAAAFGVFDVEPSVNHPALPSDIPLTVSWSTRLSVGSPGQSIATTGSYTWMDELNQNQQYDPGERYGNYNMAAVYENGESRVFVLGDSPFHDSLLPRTRNDIVLRSILHWLGGDEIGSGGSDPDPDPDPDDESIPPEQQPYWNWIQGFYPGATPGNDSAQWSPTADPDGDGVNNLFEFALERNPTVSEPFDPEPIYSIRPDGTPLVTFVFEGRSEAAFEWVRAQSSIDNSNWSGYPCISLYWNPNKELVRMTYEVDASNPAQYYRFAANFGSGWPDGDPGSGGGEDPGGGDDSIPPEQQGYWNWIQGYYPSATPEDANAAWSPESDPDGDATNNLAEYILLYNPTTADVGALVPSYQTRGDGAQIATFILPAINQAATEWLHAQRKVGASSWENLNPSSVYWDPNNNELHIKYVAGSQWPEQYRFTAVF